MIPRVLATLNAKAFLSLSNYPMQQRLVNEAGGKPPPPMPLRWAWAFPFEKVTQGFKKLLLNSGAQRNQA